MTWKGAAFYKTSRSGEAKVVHYRSVTKFELCNNSLPHPFNHDSYHNIYSQSATWYLPNYSDLAKNGLNTLLSSGLRSS